MKPLEVLLLAPESWRPVEPLTGRSSNRTSERELERIPAAVSTAKGSYAVKLWDYSPFGLAFLQPLTPVNAQTPTKGDEVIVSISFQDRNLSAPCVVEHTSLHKGGLRVGLSRSDLPRAAALPEGLAAMDLSDPQQVSGETANPLLFGEWCSLRLTGLGTGMRLIFSSNDPTLAVFVGQEISIELALSSSRASICRGRAASVWRSKEDEISFLLDPVAYEHGLAGELAEYLAVESGIAPDNLKDLGFPIRFLRDRLEFRYAETEHDYAKVRALNLETAPKAHRQGSLPETRDSGPGQDAWCRILCAFHGESLVAAATLGFPRSGKDPMRAEANFSGGRFPDWMPDKKDLVEIQGVRIHRDYRRGDLLLALVEHIARAFMLSDRSHLIRLCDEKTLPHYLKMGFRATRPEAPAGPARRRLIILEKPALFEGRRMSMAIWLALFGDLIEDLLEKGLARSGKFQEAVIRAKLKLRPWFQDRTRAKAESIFRNFLFEELKELS